mmetsp:Transcript_72502/g.169889  ORF Transcript_72502/g.169889 Transcript_72502/m.169889 type:complete len:321 (-) Transcript_72502:164-1126(-)
MAHSRARHDLDPPSAPPSAQRHLNVLAAPLGHVRVIGAHLLPVIFPYPEDPTRQGRRRVRTWVCVRLVALLDQSLPTKRQSPIETADVVVRWQVLLEVFLRDDVQNRHHQRPVVSVGAELLQQRFQPLFDHDAVRLHEDDDGTRDHRSSDDLGSDQALPLLVAVHSHLRMQSLQLLVVLPLGCIPVVNEEDLVNQLQGTVRKQGADRGAYLDPGLVEVRDDQGGMRQRIHRIVVQAMSVSYLDLRRGKGREGAGEGLRLGGLRLDSHQRPGRLLGHTPQRGAACVTMPTSAETPGLALSEDHPLEDGVSAFLQHARNVGG